MVHLLTELALLDAERVPLEALKSLAEAFACSQYRHSLSGQRMNTYGHVCIHVYMYKM